MSLNYNVWNGEPGPTTSGGLALAEERQLLAGLRGDAHYASTTPPSATSNNYEKSCSRLGLASFEKAAPAAGQPFLAKLREDARHAATASMSAKLVRSDVQQGRQGLATFEFSPLNGEDSRNMAPTNYRVAPATGWPFLAEERESSLGSSVRHVTTTPSCYMAPNRGMAPESTECPATGQPFPAEKQRNAGYAAPQLTQRERERIPSWYTSGFGSAGNLTSEAELGQQQKVTFGSAGNLAPEVELGQTQKATFGCVGSSGKSERESLLLSSEA